MLYHRFDPYPCFSLYSYLYFSPYSCSYIFVFTNGRLIFSDADFHTWILLITFSIFSLAPLFGNLSWSITPPISLYALTFEVLHLCNVLIVPSFPILKAYLLSSFNFLLLDHLFCDIFSVRFFQDINDLLHTNDLLNTNDLLDSSPSIIFVLNVQAYYIWT